jgi:hypothetical protein
MYVLIGENTVPIGRFVLAGNVVLCLLKKTRQGISKSKQTIDIYQPKTSKNENKN